jgi:hypothetical protein
MAAIEKIIGTLSGHPGVKFGRVGNRLEVEPQGPDGFPVSFIQETSGFTVLLGPCRWHFEDEKEALDHFAFGLTRKCRLREIRRGRPYRWIVEQKTAGGWSPMNETGILSFRVWKRKEERMYQNGLFG